MVFYRSLLMSIAIIFLLILNQCECCRKKPFLLGSYDTQGAARGLDIASTLAYVADFDKGLCIIDLATPTKPKQIGALDTPGRAERVHVWGNLAYLADGGGGLRIIDVSEPTKPSEIGKFEMPGQFGVLDIKVKGAIAVVAAGSNGLLILDVSIPALPSLIRRVDTNGAAISLDYPAGPYVYIGTERGLHIFSLYNPANPLEVAFWSSGYRVSQVKVIRGQAFIADDSGFYVLNAISEYYFSPTILGKLSTPHPNDPSVNSSYIVSLDVVGDRAYLGTKNDTNHTSYGMLWIVNINDLANMKSLASFNTDGIPWGMRVASPVTSGTSAIAASSDIVTVAANNAGIKTIAIDTVVHDVAVKAPLATEDELDVVQGLPGYSLVAGKHALVRANLGYKTLTDRAVDRAVLNVRSKGATLATVEGSPSTYGWYDKQDTSASPRSGTSWEFFLDGKTTSMPEQYELEVKLVYYNKVTATLAIRKQFTQPIKFKVLFVFLNRNLFNDPNDRLYAWSNINFYTSAIPVPAASSPMWGVAAQYWDISTDILPVPKDCYKPSATCLHLEDHLCSLNQQLWEILQRYNKTSSVKADSVVGLVAGERCFIPGAGTGYVAKADVRYNLAVTTHEIGHILGADHTEETCFDDVDVTCECKNNVANKQICRDWGWNPYIGNINKTTYSIMATDAMGEYFARSQYEKILNRWGKSDKNPLKPPGSRGKPYQQTIEFCNVKKK